MLTEAPQATPIERASTPAALAELKATLATTYSNGAVRYDAERSVNARTNFFFDVTYAAIDDWLGPTAPETLHVDMPVGTGRFLYDLRDRGRRHRMVGIDIAPGMLRTCREKAAARGERLATSFGDAFALPLADDSVDVLTSLRFFHLFPKRYWPALLAEMYRVLKPGGFLIAEMRNQFRSVAGAVVKEYRDRWWRRDQAHSFVRPGEVRRLFANWCNVMTRGAGLDGVDVLAGAAPRWAKRMHELARRAPLRYLTKELLIKAYKPGS